MKKVQAKGYGVTNLVAHTAAMQLTRIQGYNRGVADSWLQIHDAKALPANTAVPLKSYKQPAASAFHWAFDPGDLSLTNGCVVALSTTEATLTIHTDLADFFVDGESSWDNTGTSTAGDYTTDVSELIAWANGSGPKRLLRVEITALVSTTDSYLKIFPTSSPTLAMKPLVSLLIPDLTSKDFFFDLTPFGQSSAFANLQGCYIVTEDAPGPYNASGIDGHAIKATFK